MGKGINSSLVVLYRTPQGSEYSGQSQVLLSRLLPREAKHACHSHTKEEGLSLFYIHDCSLFS